MTITVTVRHHFSAGHRIPGLPGPGAKCTNLHGHTFGVEWTFRTDSVEVGAIEFGAAKQALRAWIGDNLDHGFIVHSEDKQVIAILDAIGSKRYVVPFPPTTELIAQVVADNTRKLLPDASLHSVLITEGPHNEARWTA